MVWSEPAGDGGPGSERSEHEDTTSRLLCESDASNKCDIEEAGEVVRITFSQDDARRRLSKAEYEKEDVAEQLAETMAHITSLLTPVSITMVLVILVVKACAEELADNTIQSPYLVFREEESDDNTTRAGKAVANSLVIVGGMLTATVFLFFLYKYNLNVVYYGWLGISVLCLLGISAGVLAHTLLANAYSSGWMSLPAVDIYSFVFFQFNFAVAGVWSIFIKAPLRVTQAYLILTSVVMAWSLSKFFPEWTMWVLLFALALYDIFAVLTPYGPLKAMVELSQERGDPIPGLVYSAAPPTTHTPLPPLPLDGWCNDCLSTVGAILDPLEPATAEAEPLRGAAAAEAAAAEETGSNRMYVAAMGGGLGGSHVSMPPSRPKSTAARGGEEEEEQGGEGVKLGLGDFVFYSVLIGRAAIYDLTTVVTCFMAILTGLILTLFSLALFRKALPALPLSIFFGIAVFFLTKTAMMPFLEPFIANQILL